MNDRSNKIETEVNGVSLFTEVEDKLLQLRNRANMLVNIIERFYKEGEDDGKLMTIETLSYWLSIPEVERHGLKSMMEQVIDERGDNRWDKIGDK